MPLDQYDRYRALRPTLALDRDQLLPLGDAPGLAFHPRLGALAGLYAAGRVAVVPGAGFPLDSDGLFDHESCQRGVQSGVVRNQIATTSGWLGRWLDGVSGGPVVPPGVDLGGGGLVLRGVAHAPLSVYSISDFQLWPWAEDSDRLLGFHRRIQEGSTEANPAAALNRTQRLAALDASSELVDRAGSYEPAVPYPEGYPLADSLRECAALITGGFGVRALTVGADGFDTHSSQRADVGGGRGLHDALLEEVSEAVAAFHADLDAQGLGDRVLSVVYSEFGRRAYENSDRGTDHGLGSAMLAVGRPVTGGVYGTYPSLSDAGLVRGGNLDVTVDFRSVYATVLGGFLGGRSRPDPGRELSGPGLRVIGPVSVARFRGLRQHGCWPSGPWMLRCRPPRPIPVDPDDLFEATWAGLSARLRTRVQMWHVHRILTLADEDPELDPPSLLARIERRRAAGPVPLEPDEICEVLEVRLEAIATLSTAEA